MKNILLYSGGLDSTTLLFDLLSKGQNVTAVWIDYSQKNAAMEERAVEYFTRHCGCKLIKVQITDVFKNSDSTLLKGCGKTTVVIRQGNHIQYKHHKTELPFRNMVLLSVGIAVGCGIYANEPITVNYGAILCGYPDCSVGFVKRLNGLAQTCSNNMVRIKAPYIKRGKDWVMRRAKKLGIETDRTWSCYCGGEVPCGICPACLDIKIVEGLYADNKGTF